LVAVLASFHQLRMLPLPSAQEIQEETQRLRAEEEQKWRAKRLRDVPSLKGLPAMQPMKIEQALILEPIDGLALGNHQGAPTWHSPTDASNFPPEIHYTVDYLAEEDNNPPAAVVEVMQYPNQAWPLYFAKWSPNPGILKDENPDLALTRVRKFGDQIVMDRQFRSKDESGTLWFFWPSGNKLVSVIYRTKEIKEEVLRQYLRKFPSSL
jgi:hypothetical protein